MRSRRPHTKPGFTRGPRIADRMTREYASFLESSLAAERSGDAATALEYHRGIPMFTRGRHVSILNLLASLADEMTPWLWARWAAYQCGPGGGPWHGVGVHHPRGARLHAADVLRRPDAGGVRRGARPDQADGQGDGGELDPSPGVHVRAWRAARVPRLHRRRAVGRVRRLGAVLGRRGDAGAAGRVGGGWPPRRHGPQDASRDRGARPRGGGDVHARWVPGREVGRQRGDADDDVRHHASRGRPADRAGGRGVDAGRLDHGLHQGAGRREARAVGPREQGPRAGLRRARAVVARGRYAVLSTWPG